MTIAMRKGFTKIDVLILFIIISLIALLTVIWCKRYTIESNQSKCKWNLREIGRAKFYYRGTKHRSPVYTWYPQTDGAHFICSFYISRILRDYNCFVCPATHDNNEKGKLITDENFVNGDSKNICSYAGRKNSTSAYPAIFTLKKSSLTAIGSDDWGPGQGDLDYNHPDVAIFLYLDSHSAEVDKTLKDKMDYLTDPLEN